MIQRIQTLYLFLVSLISLGAIFILFLWKDTSDSTVFVLDLLNSNGLILRSIPYLFISSGLLSLISIFLYKKRQNQFVLNRLNILVNLILLGVLVYLLLSLSGEAKVSEKGIGAALPLIVVVLLVMANKAIKKDEDLVKSVDRLR